MPLAPPALNLNPTLAETLEKDQTMSIFKMNALRLAMLTGAICSVAVIANAREIPFQTPEQLKGTCQAAGGSYGGKGGNGIYTCQLGDGKWIACGGKGKNAKSCSNSGPTRTGAGASTTTKGSGPIVRDHRPPRPAAGGSTKGTPIVTRGPAITRGPLVARGPAVTRGPVVASGPAVARGPFNARSSNAGFSGGRSGGGRR
jgi:hypothetical protein